MTWVNEIADSLRRRLARPFGIARADDDELRAALDAELVKALDSGLLTTALSALAALVGFSAIGDFWTGVALWGAVGFAGVLHLLVVRTSWFLSHVLLIPAYMLSAAIVGAVPIIAMPTSMQGEIGLLLFTIGSMHIAPAKLAAHKPLALGWVVAQGLVATLAWSVTDHRIGQDITLTMLGIVTIVALAVAVESTTRQQRSASHALELERVGERDELTGLFRRHRFVELVETRLVESRSGALFFIDINRFKVINDTLGHQAGDELLAAAAGRVRTVLGHDAVAGRIGGDEMALFQPGLSAANAADLARRLCALFVDNFDLVGRSVPVSASIGVATVDHVAMNVTDLIHFGDTAMYAAKRDGQPVRFFDEAMRADLLAEEETELALRDALRQDRVGAFWQPIVNVTRNDVVGFEALGRWHRDGTIVTVGECYRSARQGGLLPDITRAVARDVVNSARSLPDHKRPMVAINIEAGDLGPFLAWAQAESIDPQFWTLEVTEGQMLENFADAAEQLRQAADMGFFVFLDDFGTGHSSFSWILELPLHGVKIDASFVEVIDVNPKARAIVSAIAQLASSCGLLITAEGVERQSQVDALTSIGIDVMQGYLFGHPVTAELALSGLRDILPASAHAPLREPIGRARRAYNELVDVTGEPADRSCAKPQNRWFSGNTATDQEQSAVFPEIDVTSPRQASRG